VLYLLIGIITYTDSGLEIFMMKIQVVTVEPLVPEPSYFEVELSLKKAEKI
jgi:hypothetical protein